MHITKSPVKGLFWPLIKLCEYWGTYYPASLVKIRYFFRFGRFPNLKNPQDLNEKILWLKLYSDTSEWSKLADKYGVREYISNIGLSNILVPLLGVWDKADDINFDKLPNELIFKGSHDHTLVVNDLKVWDMDKLRSKLQSWLNEKNVDALSGEPHYRHIKQRIVAERLLPIPSGQESIVDYKFWCINGSVKFIWTCSNRVGDHTDVMTYDTNWQMHPEYSIFTSNYRKGVGLPRPDNLDEMIAVAEKLSEKFPILRVDLYSIEEKTYFGEMTFTSLGGMMDFYTQEFLNLLGNEADISMVERIH